MRDIVCGASLVVLLVITIALALPNARVDDAAAVAPSRAMVKAIRSGTGFTVCAVDTAWRRPGASESPRTRELQGSAILYDGRSSRACWTEQPQVVLFGLAATSYDAQDPRLGTLHVRPAQGHRVVILTGPIRPQIAVTSDQRLETFDVPVELVTPVAVSGAAGR